MNKIREIGAAVPNFGCPKYGAAVTEALVIRKESSDMVLKFTCKLRSRKLDTAGFLNEGNKTDIALPRSVDVLGSGHVSNFVVSNENAASGAVEFQFSFVSDIEFG